jgi:hypothetical protein
MLHLFSRSNEIPVYNVTCSEKRKMKWGKVLKLARSINFEYPLEPGLWLLFILSRGNFSAVIFIGILFGATQAGCSEQNPKFILRASNPN